MTWITDNWIAILLGLGFIAVHFFGHRGHGRRGWGHTRGSTPHPRRADTNIEADSAIPCAAASLLESEPDMNARRQAWLGTIKQCSAKAVLALGIGLAAPLQAQDTDSYQIVRSVAAYLGVMPAEIVGGHPPNHPETRMHGGPPQNAHAEHIVIALFDFSTGTRIEDARVEPTISGMGHIAIMPLTLDPMRIAGVITYGSYITFPGRDTYSIDLRISRPETPAVTLISFVYDHGGT